MNFIDLKAQQKLARKSIDLNIKKVLDHGQYIMGPEVTELEQLLAEYVGVKNCITVSSGSDALLISMMALGICPGDEVVTTPFTFVSTVEMIVLLGAKPIYVDIDEDTYNIDHKKIEQAITKKTRLIISVSLFGQCPDMTAINKVANKYKLPVIEDAAQSFGSSQNGKNSCNFSMIGCTSFFPSKPLGCYGDGGAIFTNNDLIASSLKKIRNHGQIRRYQHQMLGINGRLDTIQAAILLAKFEIFPQELISRNRIGLKYNELFKDKSSMIKTPIIGIGNTHIFSQYSILVENRDKLVEGLSKLDIPTSIHYPVPVHQQVAFLTNEFSLPISEYVAQRIISLPMHPYLKLSDQQMIVNECLSIVNS